MSENLDFYKWFNNISSKLVSREISFKKIFKYLDSLPNPIINGGESGIRTHGTFDSTQAFQACALNRSAISPFMFLYLFLKHQ